MSTGNHTAFQNMVAYFENIGLGAGGPGAATLLTATGAELNTLAGSGVSKTTLAFLAGVTAGTAAASKAFVADANLGISAFRLKSATYLYNQGAPAAVDTTATMTAANLLTGIITSSTAAAVAGTLPLGTSLETALIALFPGMQNDDSFEFCVINTGGVNAFTVTTNTGWTLVGNMVVALSSTSLFRACRTAANTFTLYRVG